MSKAWVGRWGALVALSGLGGCELELEQAARCTRICEKNELCDSKTDEADCEDSCRSHTHFSSAYMAAWTDCVAPSSVSCDLAMDPEAVEDCIVSELNREPDRELVEDVCRALSTKLEACEGGDAPKIARDCERGESVKLSDRYLEQSRECVDGPCDELERCFEELAEDYDTPLTILP